MTRKQYSRERRIMKLSLGLCVRCNMELCKGSRCYCRRHLLEHRVQERDRGGHSPQFISGIGRPPLVVPKHIG